MAFIRAFDDTQIKKMTNGENGVLFAKLKTDVLNGTVFPAVRKNELHFYYKGGCLYRFARGSFTRDKNFEKFGAGLEELSSYERAKIEVERKFVHTDGRIMERQLLDKLNCHTFDSSYSGNVIVLDIEVDLNGTVGRGKKCDIVLLNTCTDELMFVEGKVFSDSRVHVSVSFTPEVIVQVNTYTAAMAEQRQVILEQYARQIQIVNKLFGTAYRPPKKLIEPAKLLVYHTPITPTKNVEYTIDKINTELGANNVLWVKSDDNPRLDGIWNALANRPDIVVFDLETTGMNCEKDFIIEIGAVKLRYGKITDEFHSCVSCPQRLSEEVKRLTGINDEDLAGAPAVQEVLNQFYRFANGCSLAAYNLAFDWKFIKRSADLCGLNFENDTIDILTCTQHKLQGQVNNFKLSTVAAYYGIDMRNRGVLAEATAEAEILLRLAS